MNDTASTHESTVEARRQQFLSHPTAALDLMFHPGHQPDLVTFEQRKRRVHGLSADLEAWQQQEVVADPLAPSSRPPSHAPIAASPP